MTKKEKKITQGELFAFEIGSERIVPERGSHKLDELDHQDNWSKHPLRERLGAPEKPETPSWTVEEGKAFEADLPCPCGGTGVLRDGEECPFC